MPVLDITTETLSCMMWGL